MNSIYAEDEILFTLNTDPCKREHFTFIVPHHKHVITGDFGIVGKSKLRKLLTKGPNYRDLDQLVSFAFAKITNGLDNCFENVASKTKYNDNNFDQ